MSHISVKPEAPEAAKPVGVLAALLGESWTPEPALPEPAPIRRHHDALAEYHEIGHSIQAIRDAKAILLAPARGERRSVYEKSRIQASEKLCEHLKSEYDTLASKYSKALFALGESIAAHETGQARLRRWPRTFQIEIDGIEILKRHDALAVLDTMRGIVEGILMATEAECRRLGFIT